MTAAVDIWSSPTTIFAGGIHQLPAALGPRPALLIADAGLTDAIAATTAVVPEAAVVRVSLDRGADEIAAVVRDAVAAHGSAVPVALALTSTEMDISRVVGLAFAVAASTFCPLLVLGIWWRGLTSVGAATGLLVGGLSSLSAMALSVVTGGRSSQLSWLLGQPAALTVPLAFATMVAVSLATRNRTAPGVDAVLARFHLPAGPAERR